MNSSPPKRPTRSPARTASVSRRPTAWRTSSPIVWPRLSLIRLKWSRSARTTASAGRTLGRNRTSAATRSSTAPRFSSPVRGSYAARRSGGPARPEVRSIPGSPRGQQRDGADHRDRDEMPGGQKLVVGKAERDSAANRAGTDKQRCAGSPSERGDHWREGKQLGQTIRSSSRTSATLTASIQPIAAVTGTWSLPIHRRGPADLSRPGTTRERPRVLTSPLPRPHSRVPALRGGRPRWAAFPDSSIGGGAGPGGARQRHQKRPARPQQHSAGDIAWVMHAEVHARQAHPCDQHGDRRRRADRRRERWPPGEEHDQKRRVDAAARVACPDGKLEYGADTSCSMGGRGRPTISFSTLKRTIAPAPLTQRAEPSGARRDREPRSRRRPQRDDNDASGKRERVGDRGERLAARRCEVLHGIDIERLEERAAELASSPSGKQHRRDCDGQQARNGTAPILSARRLSVDRGGAVGYRGSASRRGRGAGSGARANRPGDRATERPLLDIAAGVDSAIARACRMSAGHDHRVKDRQPIPACQWA